jgi:subtilase family serine protease
MRDLMGSMIARPQGVTFPFPRGGFTPYQMRHAYGFDAITFPEGSMAFSGNGAGQTVAIIDAFDDPQIAGDLAAFDSAFGLPPPPGFRKVGQNGGAVPGASDDAWAGEISLDVEWAHTLAPAANILLVEANTDQLPDLFAAARFAAKQVGTSVVSMSFTALEFSGETSFDSSFISPPGHQGVTFVAASGDLGAPGGYPAYSPNVLAVGGTSLTLNAAGDYATEMGWGTGFGQPGSGGGSSVIESEPGFQSRVQNTGKRDIPDVAFDADPASGVPVYDTHGLSGQTGWFQYGGTSFAAPAWAALLAISNEGRLLAGKGTLANRQAMSALYTMPAANFHDILSGSNGFPAHSGYDLVTGRGTPFAAKIATALVITSFAATPPVSDSVPGFASIPDPSTFDVRSSSPMIAAPRAGAAAPPSANLLRLRPATLNPQLASNSTPNPPGLVEGLIRREKQPDLDAFFEAGAWYSSPNESDDLFHLTRWYSSI